MKIRLIEPRPPGLNVYDRAKLPRLGLPLIGALFRDAGHDVRIYVEVLAPVDWGDVLTSDLVGFSTTTSTAPFAYRMAERVRERRIPTMIGGPHVTALPEEALAHDDRRSPRHCVARRGSGLGRLRRSGRGTDHRTGTCFGPGGRTRPGRHPGPFIPKCQGRGRPQCTTPTLHSRGVCGPPCPGSLPDPRL